MMFPSKLALALSTLSFPAVLGLVTIPTPYTSGLGDGRMVTPNFLHSITGLGYLKCALLDVGVSLLLSSSSSTVCTCLSLLTPASSKCAPCPANSAPLCIHGSLLSGRKGGCACECKNGFYLNAAGTCVPKNIQCPSPNIHISGLKHDTCVCAIGWRNNETGGCVLGASGSHGGHGRRRRGVFIAELNDASTEVDANDGKCPAGERACSVDSSAAGYECLNPLTSLESCGGCSSDGTGVNCLDISGVMGVRCVQGKCEISSCDSGYLYQNGACIEA